MAKATEVQQPKKRGRKPGQKNKKKSTGKVDYQIFGELLVIDLSGVHIKKVMLTNGSGKEILEHV